MKILRRSAAVIAACLLLAGCASQSGTGDKNNNNGNNDMPHNNGAEQSERAEDEISDKCLPVISIKTKDAGADAMDFVNEPVTRFVAENIASWTPGYKIPPEPYYVDCTVSVTDKDDSLLIDSADASVKVRGNWTTMYNKKPLRIKFGTRQNILGLNDGGEYKNWVLLAEYKDISMLRDKTALMLAKEIFGKDGLYSADSQLVEVMINGEYRGVYLLSEQQQVNEGRIEITAPEKDYTGTDIGYFLEYDGYYSNEDPLHGFKMDWHGNDALTPYDGNGGSGRKTNINALNMSEVGMTIKSDIYSEEQHDFISHYVNNVYDIMYEAAYNDKAYVMSEDNSSITETSELTPQQAVEKVVDLRSLTDAYIMAELTCDADVYWSSFFMDVDMGEGGSGKLRFEAPWDFDSSMGNKDRCIDGKGYYAGNIVFDVNGQVEEMFNPWLMVLMYEDWYQDMIKERWAEIYDSGVFDRAYEMIDQDSAAYEAAFVRNYDKWDNIRHNEAAAELSAPAAACKDQKEAAGFLRSWLESRVSFLDSEWGH